MPRLGSRLAIVATTVANLVAAGCGRPTPALSPLTLRPTCLYSPKSLIRAYAAYPDSQLHPTWIVLLPDKPIGAAAALGAWHPAELFHAAPGDSAYTGQWRVQADSLVVTWTNSIGLGLIRMPIGVSRPRAEGYLDLHTIERVERTWTAQFTVRPCSEPQRPNRPAA